MGTKILATHDSDTKPNYVVSTVAAGSLTLNDGELAIFVGSTAVNQVEVINGLEKCAEAWQEDGWSNPATGVPVIIAYDISVQRFVTTLNENSVAVYRGFDFTPAGDACITHVKRMGEKYLEDVGKGI